ncbi:LytR/AlgR family response regulator transcription factor [Streptacidiphilus fuscans]|uniref:Response regulator transcription factor n=1 Tax=Streptacidiphilus fuscans TaxID=2789292 RepID=A0A931B9K6_9ACTN|nr:LytTR family DNA-binding domain-containing protein [Streptacidiphilus fuscans]MBF9072581.1 response regulator transcription factor [Streptacidiphilus fuscans]
MLQVLAVEDEAPLLEELLYLLRADTRIARADGVSNATDALRRISAAVEAAPDSDDRVDVVFLDINMPGLTGLDVARLLAGFAAPPLVVFVTAHEGFAVQAFDLKAVDYVLKPVRRERLTEAIRRACERLDAGRATQPAAPAALAAVPASMAQPPVASQPPVAAQPPLAAWPARQNREVVEAPRAQISTPDQLPIELGGVTRFVPIDEITYVEAQGDYARVHTATGSHLVRIPLTTLEERWSDRGFIRIHRSHLVAWKRIDEMRLDGTALKVRIGDVILAVSRRHSRELRELLVKRTKR